VPMKTVLVKSQRPKWLTSEFKRLLHSRDRAKKQFLNSRSAASWEKYRVQRNRVHQEKRRLKAAALNKAAKRGSKTMNRSKVEWKILNQEIGRGKSHSEITALKNGSSVVTTKPEMAELFSNEFCESQLPKQRPISFFSTLPVYGRDYSDTLQYINLSENTVKYGLSKVNEHKPAGMDGIPALFFRRFHATLAPIVTYIFNASLYMGHFPAILKESYVLPLYKGKGQRNDVSSYRPITILSPLSKLFEKLVYNDVVRFLNRQNLMSPFQHGFRGNFSTQSATVKFTNHCHVAGDKRLYTGAIFLDYKSAFPSVPHARLIFKLKHNGIRGRILRWFCTYLEERPMQVKIGSSSSKPRIMKKIGVPQGSVLGPLLFSIYINDLPKVVMKCLMLMYADDVILYYSGKTHEEVQAALQEDLDRISKWSDLNGLTISISKTKSMIFYPPRLRVPPELNIKIGEDPIECVTTFKYLGLWMDQKLSWEVHSDKVLKKMSCRANLIGRHHHSFNKRQLKQYCDSLVLSVLSYLLPVWGSVCATKLEAFDLILLRMVKRVMLDKSVLPSPIAVVDAFEKLDWLLVAELCEETMLKFFFKHFVMNNELNFLFYDMFKFRATPNSDRSVRKERNLIVPLTKTVFGQNSFSFRVVKCWNNLPATIQSQQTVLGFNTHLKAHLISSRSDGYLLKLV